MIRKEAEELFEVEENDESPLEILADLVNMNSANYYAEASDSARNREACCNIQINNLFRKYRQRVGQMVRSHNALQVGDINNYSIERESHIRVRNHAKAHIIGANILSQIHILTQTAEMTPNERRMIAGKAKRYSQIILHLWNSISASNLERGTFIRDGKFVTNDSNKTPQEAVDHTHKSITGCLVDTVNMVLAPVIRDNKTSKSFRNRLSRQRRVLLRGAANITQGDLIGKRKDFAKIIRLTNSILEMINDLRDYDKPLQNGAVQPMGRLLRAQANRENGAKILESSHDLYQRNIRRLLYQSAMLEGVSSNRIRSSDLNGASMEFEGNWLESNIGDSTVGKVTLKANFEKTDIKGFYILKAADTSIVNGESVGLWGIWEGGVFPGTIPLTDSAISTAEFVVAGGLAVLTVAFQEPSNDQTSGSPTFSLQPIVYTFDISQSRAKFNSTFSGLTTSSRSLAGPGGPQLLLNGKGFIKIMKP